MTKKTALLLILDGWGSAPDTYPAEKNAILTANTPFWDQLLDHVPNTLVATSGNAVGLPEGIMGNSEVGHTNLGAGRVVWQEITRIDKAIEKDGLASREPFVKAIEKARDEGKCLHLMGLVSDGGVHSIDRHYIALLRLAKKLEMPAERVLFHCYLDGRDTPPRSGKGFVQSLQEIIDAEKLGRIASVTGRYWAMDRDKRWDRVQKAFDALVHNQSEFTAPTAAEAIQSAYDRDENDEFVKPILIPAPEGKPIGSIQSGDQVIFFNFRPDRARQICHAFVDETFEGFDRGDNPKIELTTMTRYESNLEAAVAFPPQDISDTLGQIVSDADLTQLRIAETEKFAHVTYFFSGGREEEFPGEERILVPSPKVATYDLQPEMSLPEVAEKLEEAIRSGKYDLIVANFANGDMVGHTGIFDAAVAAARAVDEALTRIIPAIFETGGAAIITADHGNAENMWNFEADCPHTQHTTTPTPLVLLSPNHQNSKLRSDGCLGDIAPTILELIGGDLKKPESMTGQSLIKAPELVKKQITVTYVNGDKIEQGQINEEAERLRPKYEEVFAEQSPEERATQLNEWARENIIERLLVRQAALKDPEPIAAEKIDKTYEEMLEHHGGKEEFFKRFELTEDKLGDVRRDIEEGMRVERQVEAITSSVPERTEEQMIDHYQDNIERFSAPETVRASHIVMHLDPGQEDPKVLEEMEGILKKLRNNADFAELAGQYSNCPDSGGDLGVFPRGQMVPEFEDVVFDMEVGEISNIFRTDFGYHIAKVTERNPKSIIPFEEVKDNVKEELTRLTQQKAIEDFVDIEKEKATIEEKEETIEVMEG